MCQYVEIYNETIKDLLCPSNGHLDVRETAEGELAQRRSAPRIGQLFLGPTRAVEGAWTGLRTLEGSFWQLGRAGGRQQARR